MQKIILFVFLTVLLSVSPCVQIDVLAQRAGTEFAPEKQGRKRKATVPDNPERQEKNKQESGDKDKLASDGDNKVAPGETEEEHRGRRWWRNFFKTKKKEYKEHHERIQTDEVRKRMKDNKKHSQKINKGKKAPRKVRNTTRKK